MRLRLWRKKKKKWFTKERLQSIWQFMKRENLDRLIFIVVIILTVSSVGLTIFEGKSVIDALWWSIVTLTTVGYGDITPVTLGGRLIAIMDMMVGIGVLATFSATIASLLVDQKIKEDLGMKSYDFQDHIILCEWNYRAKVILQELRLEPKTRTSPIVLVANIDRKPVEDQDLFFVQGEVCDDTLEKANLVRAKTVIILGDDRINDIARDAKVILSTLTVESINPRAYTIVELVDAAYISTCKRANADEIIVTSELSSMLISQATLNHGVSKVVSDLLSFQGSNQLYTIPVPKCENPQTFIEVLTQMKEKYQGIVVGVQKGKNGEVISNPSSNYIIDQHDYLIVIANQAIEHLIKVQ